MESAVASATSQAVIMTAASNAFAQGWTAYQKNSLSALDFSTFTQFILLSILVTPPNYLWQKYLEDSFPTNKVKEEGKSKEGTTVTQPEEKLSITNTVIKFLLDQSLGCWVNTALFVMVMGMFKGRMPWEILSQLSTDFWPMVLASYKLWPMICLLNLVVVPFDYRMLVGNTAAFGWGIYVSLTAA